MLCFTLKRTTNTIAACDKGSRALKIPFTVIGCLLTNPSRKDALPASTAPKTNTPPRIPKYKTSNTAFFYLSFFFLPFRFPSFSSRDIFCAEMSRRSRYDEDARRLPEGMKRVGYNSNSQRYTFQDQNDGTFWEGPEGARFGKLMQSSYTHFLLLTSPFPFPSTAAVHFCPQTPNVVLGKRLFNCIALSLIFWQFRKINRQKLIDIHGGLRVLH